MRKSRGSSGLAWPEGTPQTYRQLAEVRSFPRGNAAKSGRVFHVGLESALMCHLHFPACHLLAF